MKKTIGLAFSFIALISIAACQMREPTSVKKEPTTSFQESEPSSFYEEESSEPVISSIEPSTSIPVDVYYHVVFQNYDETILEEIDVLEGKEASYSGEDPTREEDDEFTYEFIGWDQDLKSITSDVTAIAQYKATAKQNWGPINW